MGWNHLTINGFIRQAGLAASAEGGGATASSILLDLQAEAFEAIKSGGGDVIATSGNGKSATFSFAANLNYQQIFELTEQALQILEADLTKIPSRTTAVFR
jgi:hypothetical protein